MTTIITTKGSSARIHAPVSDKTFPCVCCQLQTSRSLHPESGASMATAGKTSDTRVESIIIGTSSAKPSQRCSRTGRARSNSQNVNPNIHSRNLHPYLCRNAVRSELDLFKRTNLCTATATHASTMYSSNAKAEITDNFNVPDRCGTRTGRAPLRSGNEPPSSFLPDANKTSKTAATKNVSGIALRASNADTRAWEPSAAAPGQAVRSLFALALNSGPTPQL